MQQSLACADDILNSRTKSSLFLLWDYRHLVVVVREARSSCSLTHVIGRIKKERRCSKMKLDGGGGSRVNILIIDRFICLLLEQNMLS